MKQLLSTVFALSALLLPSACTFVTLGPADEGGDRDEQVIDASLETEQAPAWPAETAASSQPAAAGCDFSHPSVGATGELITRFHEVAGLVTVLDDCTLLIEDFQFDGNGLDVRLYGAKAGNFSGGLVLSAGLYNWPVGYAGETLEVTLPTGVTLDDFDSVSIWCVTAGVSFGDTTLTQPS